MKAKDIGAAVNALLPSKLRMPGRMSTPFGPSGDGFSRKHQLVTSVENDDAIGNNSARKLLESTDEDTSRLSHVDSVVLALRAKHAEKLEEDLRSIGVLRQDKPCVLQTESTNSSTTAPDAQKTPESGRGGSGVTQTADVPKVSSSPVDAAALLNENVKQHDGNISDTADPLRAEGVPENVTSYGDCHMKDIPADSSASRDRLLDSSRVPVKRLHLKPLTVECQTQTLNVSPTAIEADVLESAPSGVAVTPAVANTRDVAAGIKWDKATNCSSDYDADDDDDYVDDGSDLIKRPHTPRTAVSRWGQETYRKNETQQPVEQKLNDTEHQVEDLRNEAELQVEDERKFTEWQVEDERKFTEWQIEDERNETELQVNDMRYVTEWQIDGEPNVTELPVEDEPNETELPVEDEPNETELPVEDEPNETELPVEDEPNETELPVEDEPNDTELQVEDEPNETELQVEDEPNETELQVDEVRNETKQDFEEQISWQKHGVNEGKETESVDEDRIDTEQEFVEEINETEKAKETQRVANVAKWDKMTTETEWHVEGEQQEKTSTFVPTRRANAQKNVTRRKNIDSYAHVRKYLMKNVPEVCSEVPEVATYTEKTTQASGTLQQVWPLFVCVMTVR